MKKTIIRIISMVLALSMLPIFNIGVFAGTSGVSDGFEYILCESEYSKWIEITGYTGQLSGELVIPSYISGVAVKKIGDNAFANSVITSVSLPCVSTIGKNAFSNCFYLREVIIGSDYTLSSLRIYENAFKGCSQMKSIAFPAYTEGYFIGNMAFSSCSSLSRIYFNNTKERYDACSINISEGNDYFKNAEVFYIDSVKDINLNKTSMLLIKSNSEKLLPTITPSDATNKTIIWSSSDENIATVSSDGTVTGTGAGTATITAKTEDKNLIATCVVTVTDPLQEDTLGGDGTASNPYKIYSEETLQTISDIPNAHYVLTKDITLTDKFRPLCTLDSEFSGILDGNGYTISNLTISDFYSHSGLMGRSIGTIKNLNVIYSDTGANYTFSKDINFGGIVGYNNGNVINCSVDLNTNIIDNTEYDYIARVGGIVGENDSNGSIANCHVDGQLVVETNSNTDKTKRIYIGGISGTNINYIDNCDVDLSITHDVIVDGYLFVSSTIGGISGSSQGTIKNSNVSYDMNIGEVSDLYAGGVVGTGTGCIIENVTTKGEINSIAHDVCSGGIIGSTILDNTSKDVSIVKTNAKIIANISESCLLQLGGIAGAQNGYIQESCANVDFNVTSDHYCQYKDLCCGGLAGYSSGEIDNCFATGSIDSLPASGGLVGSSRTDSKISNSYAAVSGVDYGLSKNYVTVTNSFYDSSISGCSDTGYGSPTASVSMKLKSVYLNAGWDFDNIWGISSSINDGYPHLRHFADSLVSSVSTPTASVVSGNINQGTTVTLATETKDAIIYYTTDGSTPTTSSAIYTQAIAITTDTTIKAIAIKEGMTDSAVAIFSYTVLGSKKTTISISDAKAEPGDTVTLTLDISNNPGIAGMMLKLSYDDGLNLTSITKGNALANLTFTPSADITKKPCTLVWDGLTADSTNGTLLNLTFKIDDPAVDGEYDVAISYTDEDIYDGDLNNLDVQIDKGIVTVNNYKSGDLNEDTSIDVRDVILLRKFIAGGYEVIIDEDSADVLKDGILNVKDVTTLRRFIAGGYDIVLD